MAFSKPSKTFKVFEYQPPANRDTFERSLPATNTLAESLSIVMFTPDLQLVASMDNTESDAECSFEKSVTTGFTFGTQQSISISTMVAVSIEIVKVSTTVTLGLSFTEEWSKSTTDSMNFTCPPGKKAYVYQGTLKSRVLRLDSETGEYSWKGQEARALTPIMVTRREPFSGPSAEARLVKQD